MHKVILTGSIRDKYEGNCKWVAWERDSVWRQMRINTLIKLTFTILQNKRGKRKMRKGGKHGKHANTIRISSQYICWFLLSTTTATWTH